MKDRVSCLGGLYSESTFLRRPGKMKENGQDEKQKYPAVTSEVTLFLFSLGLFAVLPTSNNMLLTKVCLQHFGGNSTEVDQGVSMMEFCRNTSNPEVGKNDYVQEQQTRWNMFISLAYFIPAFITAIYAGSWGDKLGRKFPLLTPPPGFIITCIALAVFDLYIDDLPMYFLILASCINGLAGGE